MAITNLDSIRKDNHTSHVAEHDRKTTALTHLRNDATQRDTLERRIIADLLEHPQRCGIDGHRAQGLITAVTVELLKEDGTLPLLPSDNGVHLTTPGMDVELGLWDTDDLSLSARVLKDLDRQPWHPHYETGRAVITSRIARETEVIAR